MYPSCFPQVKPCSVLLWDGKSPPGYLHWTKRLFKSCTENEGYTPEISTCLHLFFLMNSGTWVTGGLVHPAARARRRARRGKGPMVRLSFEVVEPCVCSCALSIVPTCRWVVFWCMCCLCVWLLVCLRGDAHKEGLGYEREVLDTAIVGYWVTK